MAGLLAPGAAAFAQLENGALDTTFGGDGNIVVDFHGGGDFALVRALP
jgi:hypothetical protein